MNTLTVSQVNTYIKALLDGSEPLKNIFVQGELSNFKLYRPSGHMYFTLKDEKSQLKAVMFSSNASRLRFMPENGASVICRGKISAYEKSGEYQLYAEDMQPVGAGALSLQFEQLKKKLFAEGVCSEAVKKLLPAYPQKIGVATSSSGAAIQDIINITARRYPLAQLIIAPCAVQGEKAAPEIVSALKRLDSRADIDVIIVGRGGGSMEDLWAFNTEEVARAVIACRTPVVSAVGHESDFTICDFVSDMRAPTPSAAAELVCPDINALREQTASLRYTMQLYMRSQLDELSRRLGELTALSPLADGEALIAPFADRLSSLSQKLAAAFEQKAQTEFQRFSSLAGRLNALSPLAVLERGFAVASQGGGAVSSVRELDLKKALNIRFTDGSAGCTVNEVIFDED